MGTMDDDNEHLNHYFGAARRRGAPGGRMKRTTLNHTYGGRSTAKRKLEKEQAAEAAQVRSEESRKFRELHTKRLDLALWKGGGALAEMLVFSERLLRIAGEGLTPIISEAQERRVRAQCLGVANYYRVLDLHHPEVEAVDCAAIAAAWSGSICSGWTIYRWSLEYVENSGKFLSDGRGDFDRDCFITSNEDIKRDLRDWMRAHLRGLNRADGCVYINKTLIPKYVGLHTGSGEDECSAAEVHNDIVNELEEKWHIKGSVCEYTAGRWMALAGGEYVKKEKNYYCDGHELEKNVAYREKYLKRDQGVSLAEPSKRELGQFLWIQMTKERAQALFAAHEADGAAAKLEKSAHHYTASGIEANFVGADGVVTDESKAAAMAAAIKAELPNTRRQPTPEQARAATDKAKAAVEAKIAAARGSPGVDAVEMVELHVELSEALDDWRSTQSRGGHVSVRYPRDEKPIIVNGQDESIYSSESAPGRTWRVDGKVDCTPKNGSGIMASAYVNCVSGFGLPMTQEQLDGVNEKRRGERYICGRYGAPQALCKLAGLPETDLKPPLKESPGLRLLHYGKDKDGYWNADYMMVHMEDHKDAVEYLYPDCQFIDEYDWSGVHGAAKPDGLNAHLMNVKFGGAVGIKHDTKITAGCLGLHPAVIKVGAVEYDRKLVVGQVQSMVFGESDPPPFYDLGCPKHDFYTGEMRKKKKKKKQKGGVHAQMAQEEEGGGRGGGRRRRGRRAGHPPRLRGQAEGAPRCAVRTWVA